MRRNITPLDIQLKKKKKKKWGPRCSVPAGVRLLMENSENT